MKQPQLPSVDFEECRLGNGLQVVLYRNDRVPLVHLSLHYRVGSSYERPGMSGFAHLFEHMMFQGSDNVGKNEHGRYVDEAGGVWNASTSKDRTNYYETVPSHYLNLALWLEADRMRSLRVTQENFDNQRKTVVEEKKQSYDNRPYGLAYLKFDELAYQNWAYAHSIIGSVTDLETASLADAVDFHRTYYRPSNATLVLAGDLEENVLGQVEKYFSELPDQKRPGPPDLTEPERENEETTTIGDPLAVLPAVSVGYHMPELGSPEYYALSVLAFVLARGESSRLYRLLVYDNNWVMNLAVGPNQYKGPELFQICFQVQSEVRAEKVLQSVEQELKRAQDEKISGEEIQKAKNQIAFRFMSRLTKVSQIGELLAYYALFYDDPHLVNRHLEYYLRVTEEDILNAAEQVFRKQSRTLMIVEPRKG